MKKFKALYKGMYDDLKDAEMMIDYACEIKEHTPDDKMLADELAKYAKYRLEQEGFVVDYTEVYHDTVKEGKVFKTSPDVGTEQQKGTTVIMSVSKGAETKYTTMPSVVNTTRENAEVAIKNAGLVIGSITEEFSDTVALGNVISQSTAAGESVEEGVTIDLVVSKGPEKLTMPNLWGNPKDRAIEKLHAMGLSVEVYEEYSDAVEGRVFKTNPEADATSETGIFVVSSIFFALSILNLPRRLEKLSPVAFFNICTIALSESSNFPTSSGM